MADKKRVNTSYDSGGKDTAKSGSASHTNGDWGNDAPVKDDGNDKLLGIVLEDIDAAREYTKNMASDWEKSWKCYNMQRTKRGYEGISDRFVPESFTIIESVKANIAGGKPKATFVPMMEEQSQDTDVLNDLMEFYWDQNRMSQKTLNWVQDMLLYGNGVLYISWEGDMPRIRNIPLPDFFVDPTSTHMNNPNEQGYPKFAGFEYLTSLDELKKEKIVDPKTGEMVEMYTGLDDIPAIDGDYDKLDQETKNGFIGSTLGKKAPKEQIRCAVYFTKKKKIIVANRKKIIYEGRNPYFRDAKKQKVNSVVEGLQQVVERDVPKIDPFLPFAVLRNYVDGSLFYAKGDMAIILDSQETLNDLSNQKQDNITYVLNNMWQIDPQFAYMAEQIQSVPGAVYPIPKGALTAIEKQVVTSEADIEMARIKDEMRRATAADEVIQGASSDNSRTTATEITATINQATQRFTTKLNTLEGEGYTQLYRILFMMTQIFVDQQMVVRVVGPEGVSWKDFDPNEFTGEYEPKVTLESTQKALKAEEGQKFLQVHQAFAQSPYIDQKEFARIYLTKVLDLPEEQMKRLIIDPMPMMGGPMSPLPAGMPGGQSGQFPIPQVG